MTETNSKIYNLEDRSRKFAIDVRLFVKKLPKTIENIEDGKQVVRSSGSIGANYIEANESLSKKDFIMRVKISRKEAKESYYWLKIILAVNGDQYNNECQKLIQEAEELKKIFCSIVEKSQK